MIINIADKGIKLDQKSVEDINKHFQKVNKLLPHFNPDLLSVNFFIRKNDDKYHVKRKYRHTAVALAHFEGWIRLILPKKALYTHFKGADVQECIHIGVKSLIKEIKKYKDLHFKSQSQYPNRKTIRKIC